MRTLSTLALAPVALAVGCGSSSPPAPAVDPPAAPATNDPAAQVSDLERWYLIGNDLTPGEDTLRLRTIPPDRDAEYVDAWIAGGAGVRLTEEDGIWSLEADVSALGPGDHEILLAADGADTAYGRYTLRRSHPLYAMVTTDWDFSDPSDPTLDFHTEMHEAHPGVLITHFIGPYTFTDPDVSDDREAELVAWMKSMRDDWGDEIALHIHPYCHFVEYAGLTCIIDQSTVYEEDPSGYTIGLWAYGDQPFRTLLEAADGLFMERGLGKPVTFRAGGWTATIETLRALAATGYVADTSANNWARMEEWIPGPLSNATLYEWNMENWSTIGDTSQPYYPNDGDILSADGPTLSILEVPDNAIMVDYVTVQEMTDIFWANWDGEALSQPVSYMMGFHPAEQFGADERSRVDGFLDLADAHLASADAGPVVYALLRDMPRVWKRN